MSVASHASKWWWTTLPPDEDCIRSENPTGLTYTEVVQDTYAPGLQVNIQLCCVCRRRRTSSLIALCELEVTSRRCEVCRLLLKAWQQCLPQEEHGTHLILSWEHTQAEATVESAKNLATHRVRIGKPLFSDQPRIT